MKLMKLTSLVGVLTLSVSLALSGCGGGSGTENETTTADAAISEESTMPEDVTTASVETEETEGRNNFMGTNQAQVDCSFKLEGKSYTLPFAYSQLEADGWTTDIDMDQELDAYTYTFIHIRKDGKDETISVDLFNGTGNTQKLKDCKVSAIEFTERLTQSYSFELGNGIKPGDDQATVTAAMGTPTNTSDSDSYSSIYYGESRDSGQIGFVWWKDAETVANGNNQLTVSYYQREGSATSNEVPAYLSEYKAPSAMGGDFDSSTFTLDGTVYQLPCPVTEFTKNGWTITDSEDIPAGRESYGGYMEKNGVKLSVNFYNYADYQTTAENCAVSEIEANVYGEMIRSPICRYQGESTST